MRTELAGSKHWVLFAKHEHTGAPIEGFSPITLYAIGSEFGDRRAAEDMVVVAAMRYYRDTTGIAVDPTDQVFTLDRKPVLSKESLTFNGDDGTLYYAKPIDECENDELRSILLEYSDTIDPFTQFVAKNLLNKKFKDVSLFGEDFEEGFNFCKDKYAEMGFIPVDDAIQVFSEHIHTSLDPKSEHSIEALRIKILKSKGAPTKVDWAPCPICGEPDMRREWFSSDDGPYIHCTNLACASNGGSQKN